MDEGDRTKLTENIVNQFIQIVNITCDLRQISQL